MSYSRLCRYCNEKIVYISNINGKIRVFEDPFFTQVHVCPKFIEMPTLIEMVKRLEKKVASHEIQLNSIKKLWRQD